MSGTIVFIFSFILSISGCFFCPHWIKTARDSKDRARGIFCLVTSIIMVPLFSWSIIYNNNLLWYGQHKENAQIEMNINDKVVEKSSFIYLLKEFDADTTVTDVISIMGNYYEESDITGYELKYPGACYTINDSNATFVSFVFNRRKTKILSIKWAYKSPSQEMFSQTLEYLENNALGKANSISKNNADWRGLHLEDTEYYLLLIREF